MTHEENIAKFIKKWRYMPLLNMGSAYIELTDEIQSDLTALLKKEREQVLREVYETLTDYESTGLALYVLNEKVPGLREAMETEDK